MLYYTRTHWLSNGRAFIVLMSFRTSLSDFRVVPRSSDELYEWPFAITDALSPIYPRTNTPKSDHFYTCILYM